MRHPAAAVRTVSLPRRPTRQPGTRAVITALLAVGLVVPDAQAQPGIAADTVKAAFVARFPEFVEWPPELWEGRDQLEICVASPNALHGILGEVTEGTTLAGREVVVRDVEPADDVTTCHVLFVSSPEPDRQQALLDRVGSLPVLTIGDTPGFLDRGGVINLMLVGRRVRFAVDMTAAERARLRVSSQLLRLASTVRGGAQ